MAQNVFIKIPGLEDVSLKNTYKKRWVVGDSHITQTAHIVIYCYINVSFIFKHVYSGRL